MEIDRVPPGSAALFRARGQPLTLADAHGEAVIPRRALTTSNSSYASLRVTSPKGEQRAMQGGGRGGYPGVTPPPPPLSVAPFSVHFLIAGWEMSLAHPCPSPRGEGQGHYFKGVGHGGLLWDAGLHPKIKMPAQRRALRDFLLFLL